MGYRCVGVVRPPQCPASPAPPRVTEAAMSAPPIQDHFVTVRAENAALVAEVVEAQQAVEAFYVHASSLMKLGQTLFSLAFPRYEDVIAFASQLASAVRGG